MHLRTLTFGCNNVFAQDPPRMYGFLLFDAFKYDVEHWLMQQTNGYTPDSSFLPILNRLL